MASKPILKRSEVPVENTWDLSHLFESDQAWLEEYEAQKVFPEMLEAYKGRLGSSPEVLLEYLRLQDEIAVRLGKLYRYASCSYDQDTANGFYQDLISKARYRHVSSYSASAFSDPEIMEIPDEKLESFFAALPELEEYRRPLEKVRRLRQHTLTPELEQLLAAAKQMSSAPDEIGSIFRNAELKFPNVEDSQGNQYALTNGTLTSLMESDDHNFRSKVFDTYYDRLGQFKNTIAATVDAQFKQLRFYANARKYPNTLEAALDVTEVPVEVYHNLIEAVHNNLDKMYHYVSLRKKMLGLKELHMCDVYPPLVADAAHDISIEEAKETILEALAILGDDYVEMLKEGFDNRWIDLYENEGKRTGAYSTGGGRPHPYVLMNYKDNLSTMFTLAHEMGHALHSYLSTQNQPICTSTYVIFVAEVASTCNEVLLMHHLLSKTTDKNTRKYLLNHFLDEFKGTIYRQTMFAEFELIMGRLSEQGVALTADVLCREYLKLNKLYFGPDMISDEGIALEWARIPHFFYNYYVFQYATGFSAAVAIANRIIREGESAVADYKRFLSSGGSADPISLLKIAGVDMSTPKPVNEALEYFGSIVDELEKLHEEE